MNEILTTPITSESVGSPELFLTLSSLEEGLSKLSAQGEDSGRVSFLMRRGQGGRRQILDRAQLTVQKGVPGDKWGRSSRRAPDMQIAVMQRDVAQLIANGQPLALFGDCLILDLDLSKDNLPAGSQVQIGSAVLQVTPEPHNGCRKFRDRFGADALRFVSMKQLRHKNLRGIYMRVVSDGEVAIGEPVTVTRRAASSTETFALK